MILFPRPHLWLPRSPALLMAPPWDEEAARALEYTDNISCGMPAAAAATLIHLSFPNDLGTMPWVANSMTATSGASDPLFGTTATSLVSAGTVAFAVNDQQPTGTLTPGTVYQISGYFKTIVAPAWIIFQVGDASSEFGGWINLAGPTLGNANTPGNGVLDSSSAVAAGNGYVLVTFTGHFTGATTSPGVQIFLVDGNGTGVGTVGQQVNAWQVCP